MKKKLLVLDDEQSVLDSLSRTLAEIGDGLILCAEPHQALERLKSDQPQVVVTDLKMPGMDGLEVLQRIKRYDPKIQVIVITGHGSIDEAVAAMKKGAYDFIPKPFNRSEILAVVNRAFEKAALLHENLLLREKLKNAPEAFEAGKSRAFRNLLNRALQTAHSDATVLILGEPGTGKEMLAGHIVRHSRRALKPFVTVNCAATPADQIEPELFGGGKDGGSRLAEADGGTVFLDEVGALPLSAQARLLRLLKEGKAAPADGGPPVLLDVRVIAATHGNLRKMAEEGTFRKDLFSRLNALSLAIPPLRERPGDLHALISHFIAAFCRKNNRPNLSVAGDAMKLMERYPWPGNVRELENAIERAVILCLGHQITADDLPPELGRDGGTADGIRLLPGMKLADVEMAVIRGTLEKNRGDKAKTAEELGVSLRTIYRKLDEPEEGRQKERE